MNIILKPYQILQLSPTYCDLHYYQLMLGLHLHWLKHPILKNSLTILIHQLAYEKHLQELTRQV